MFVWDYVGTKWVFGIEELNGKNCFSLKTEKQVNLSLKLNFKFKSLVLFVIFVAGYSTLSHLAVNVANWFILKISVL